MAMAGGVPTVGLNNRTWANVRAEDVVDQFARTA